MVSSPGLTGRSSNHRPRILDCPVKPGNDTGRIGYVSSLKSSLVGASARDDYGVVLRDDLSIDLAATKQLREAMRISPGKFG